MRSFISLLAIAVCWPAAGQVPPGPASPTANSSQKQSPGIWPGIAVDPEIVKQQQELVRADCSAMKKAGKQQLDCDCIVSGYPDFRLRNLSEQIRQAEREMKAACDRDQGCAPFRAQFDWITGRDAQVNYPTAVGRPARPRAPSIFGIPDFKRQLLPLVYVQLANKCVDGGAVGNEAHKNCMQVAASGMWSNILKPGTTVAAFCGCVRDKVAAGASESEAQITCSR